MVSISRWHNYVEKPTEFTKQLIELANESIKITGYKVYIQNSIIFLYPDKREENNIF